MLRSKYAVSTRWGDALVSITTCSQRLQYSGMHRNACNLPSSDTRDCCGSCSAMVSHSSRIPCSRIRALQWWVTMNFNVNSFIIAPAGPSFFCFDKRTKQEKLPGWYCRLESFSPTGLPLTRRFAPQTQRPSSSSRTLSDASLRPSEKRAGKRATSLSPVRGAALRLSVRRFT